MEIFKIFNKLKKKEVYPKIFALSLKSKTEAGALLWQGLAYDFEEAMKIAMGVINKEKPEYSGKASQFWAVEIFVQRPLKEFICEATGMTVEEIDSDDRKQEKNEVMKKIIITKDKKMLEENREKFDANEIKLIEEKIFKK